MRRQKQIFPSSSVLAPGKRTRGGSEGDCQSPQQSGRQTSFCVTPNAALTSLAPARQLGRKFSRYFLLPLLALLTGTGAPRLAAAEARPERQVLVLGDSLTEGYGVAKEAAYPALLAGLLKAKGYKDVAVINAGISGSTSASGPSRIKWYLKGKTLPSVLFLALGANDGLRGLPVKALGENLTAVIQLAKKADVKHIIVAGMQMPPNYGQAYTDQFRAIFPAVAAAEHTALMPFLLAGVAADKTLNQGDGMHPNERGHQILAANVLPYVMAELGPP